MHPSLNGKMTLEPRYKMTKYDFEPCPKSLDFLSETIPVALRRPGVAHIVLTDIDTSSCSNKTNPNGITNPSTLCEKQNNRAAAIVRWKDNIGGTAQSFAHEVGHILGMYHDHELPKTGRFQKCDHKIMMMGYSTSKKKRSSTWSDCSNEDFENYYHQVVHAYGDFCLRGNFYNFMSHSYLCKRGRGGHSKITKG